MLPPKPAEVPEYAVLLSVDGQTRFPQYNYGGVPIPMMCRYWVWEGGRYAEAVEMTPEEFQSLEDTDIKGRDGTALAIKYKDWRRRYAS